MNPFDETEGASGKVVDQVAEVSDGFVGRLILPTIRFVLTAVFLLVLRFVLVRIPGQELVILEPGITVGLVIYGVLTLLLMGAVLSYASAVGGIVAAWAGLTDIQRIVQLVALLGVLVWAHGAFFWVPYFVDNPNQYDLMFLLVGLVFGIWLALVLFTNIDSISNRLAGEIRNSLADGGTESADGGEHPRHDTEVGGPPE